MIGEINLPPSPRPPRIRRRSEKSTSRWCWWIPTPPRAWRRWRTCLKPEGFALTLQNGIGNFEALAERLGPGRVLAGSTFNSGANLGPGRAAHTNLGPTGSANLTERSRSGGGDRAKIQHRRAAVRGGRERQGVVWSKFVHNCAINPVAAATGLRSGEIARNPAAADASRILAEVLRWSRRKTSALPEADPHEAHPRPLLGTVQPALDAAAYPGRPADGDRRAERRARKAREAHGIPVPANQTIVAVVKGLEAAGRRDGSKLDEKRSRRRGAPTRGKEDGEVRKRRSLSGLS